MSQPQQDPLDAVEVVICLDSLGGRTLPVNERALAPLLRPRPLSPVSREELAAYPLDAPDLIFVVDDLEDSTAPPDAGHGPREGCKEGPANGQGQAGPPANPS
jgi:hypothetical protein